ncbi:hypothetical protein AE03_03348 [Klebsiella aerogenes MGH 77]|nr:hypothetical protein AE03_03348 [Klebsiella aerogenes MGH 77]
MKRYTPDFPEMMRLCETNFAQLRRLLPRTEAVGDMANYQVGGGAISINGGRIDPLHYISDNRTDYSCGELLEPAVNDGAPVSRRHGG